MQEASSLYKSNNNLCYLTYSQPLVEIPLIYSSEKCFTCSERKQTGEYPNTQLITSMSYMVFSIRNEFVTLTKTLSDVYRESNSPSPLHSKIPVSIDRFKDIMKVYIGER